MIHLYVILTIDFIINDRDYLLYPLKWVANFRSGRSIKANKISNDFNKDNSL